MEFVTFHAALAPDREVHPNQQLRHQEYLSMIDMMFASARHFHPGAHRTVLTDTHTRFDGLARRVDRIVRQAIDSRKLMLERTRCQLRHVQASTFKRPMVVLDSDILINASLQPIMGQPFDVALTWRELETMPINGGLLILNNARPQVAKRFFERYADLYHNRYMDQAAWFGDQLALRDCLGSNLPKAGGRSIVEVDGCRFLLLPCETYNYSPENQFTEICSALPEKVALHFKGERKRLMGPFWRAWLNPRRSRAPWVQYTGWKERRWLHQQSGIESQALLEAQQPS